MGIRFNLTDFTEGLTQAATGLIAGEMQAQEINRQRQAEQYSQLLQAVNANRQADEAYRSRVLGQIPNLDPGSQQAALDIGLQRPDYNAPLRQSPYVQQRPELRQIYDQPQQPAAPTLKPRGISKEAVGARQREMARLGKALADRMPHITDPKELGEAQGVAATLATLDVTTPEGFREAVSWMQRASALEKLGGIAEQKRKDTEAERKRDEEAAVGKEIRAYLAEQNPLSITPAGVKALYANWKGKDYSYLLQGVPESQLQLGDARLWDRRGQITGQLASQVNVDEKTQNILLSELKLINKRLGIEEEPVPPKITPRQPTPREAAEEARKAAEEARRQAEEGRKQEAERRAKERHEQEMKKLRLENEKKLKGAGGKFTDVQKAQLDSAGDALVRARTDVKNAGVSPTRVDLSSPRPSNPRQGAAWDMAQRLVEAEMRLYHTEKALGLNPKLPSVSMWAQKKPGAPAAPPEREPWGKRIFREAKEWVTRQGEAAQASDAGTISRERRAKIIQDLKRAGATDKEINAELRERKLLPAR